MKKIETGKDKDAEKFNLWFHYCIDKQLPYVIVKNKTKYSSVEWDFITFDEPLREMFSSRNDDYTKKVIDIFKKYCCNKSNYTVSCHLFFFKMIPKENAEKFAEEIFDLLFEKVEKSTAFTNKTQSL